MGEVLVTGLGRWPAEPAQSGGRPRHRGDVFCRPEGGKHRGPPSTTASERVLPSVPGTHRPIGPLAELVRHAVDGVGVSRREAESTGETAPGSPQSAIGGDPPANRLRHSRSRTGDVEQPISDDIISGGRFSRRAITASECHIYQVPIPDNIRGPVTTTRS
jgi:hypothetical protein